MGKKSNLKRNHEEDETETNLCLVPAVIQLFFQIEHDPTIYSVVHSCHYRKDKSSVLSVMWMKEYHGIPISSFSMYKNNEIDNVGDLEPVLHVVSTHSIHSHCLLVPYKRDSCFMLQIIHPSQWANEFLEIP